MSAIIGLDHGSRRIGVAIGDEETGLAFARPALRRRNEAADLAQLAALARAEGAQRVVLGLPRNMDGSESGQAELVRAFGTQLGAIGLEVVFVDERLSSWQASEELREAGRRVSRASGERDSVAARLILQEYLDARATQARPQETR